MQNQELDLSKVDEDRISAQIEALGLDSDGTTDQLVDRLQTYYETKAEEENLTLYDCNNCGAAIIGESAECPFCGDEDTDDNSESVKDSAADDSDDNDDDEDQQEETDPEEGDQQEEIEPDETPKGRKKAPKKKSPKKTSKKAVKKATKVSDDSDDENDDPDGPTPTAIVAEDGTQIPITVELLDKQVKRVLSLKGKVTKDLWDLGHTILEIYESQSYRQRLNEKGQAAYKSWKQFCQTELGMSRQYAFRMMDAAKFFTREQVQGISVNKLSLLVRVDKAEREKLLGEAQGLSEREIQERVQKIEAEKGSSRKPRSSSDGTERNPTSNAKPRKSNKLTVITSVDRVEIPLFARPKKDGAEPKPAKTLSHEPYGTEQFENGVVFTYYVTKNDKGDLVLKVERRRENPESAATA